MLKKRSLAALILAVVCPLGLQAATVSFLVVESGLPKGAAVNQHTNICESGLLDVFFEAGHIVSNAPVLRLSESSDSDFPGEAREEFDQAVAGGADYFVLALLDYDSAGNSRPQNISLRMFRVSPFRKILEKHYADKTSKTAADEFANMKKFAKGLVPHLKDK